MDAAALARHRATGIGSFDSFAFTTKEHAASLRRLHPAVKANLWGTMTICGNERATPIKSPYTAWA